MKAILPLSLCCVHVMWLGTALTGFETSFTPPKQSKCPISCRNRTSAKPSFQSSPVSMPHENY